MDSYVSSDNAFYCHNSDCPTFGLRNKSNLRYEGFSGNKRELCDRTQAADKDKGDQWNHTAIDAETRLLIGVVPGRRILESCVTLVKMVKDKTGDRTELIYYG